MAYRTTPKMAKRKEAHRKRILAAALFMFGHHGYHRTTVPMIVAKASSSTGSFYFHFRNKEDVFSAALQSIGDSIAAALNAAIAAATDPQLQMRAAVERLLRYLAEKPGDARILIVESSGLTQRLERIRRAIISSHCRSVEQALTQLSAVLPPIDPSVAARCWVGAVYEAAYHWLETPSSKRPPIETVAREVVRFNLRGIGGSGHAIPKDSTGAGRS